MNDYQLHRAFVHLRGQYRKLLADHLELLNETRALWHELRQAQAALERLRRIDAWQHAERQDSEPLN